MKHPPKRTYIKCGIWYLGRRKMQKGEFLPIIVSLAKPLLVSMAGTVGGEILKGLGSKIFVREKENRKEEKEEEEGFDIPKNNILLQRFLAPKCVQPLNSRVFFAKYQNSW